MSDDYRAGIVEGLRRAAWYAAYIAAHIHSDYPEGNPMWWMATSKSMLAEWMATWLRDEADRLEREGVGDPPNPT